MTNLDLPAILTEARELLATRGLHKGEGMDYYMPHLGNVESCPLSAFGAINLVAYGDPRLDPDDDPFEDLLDIACGVRFTSWANHPSTDLAHTLAIFDKAINTLAEWWPGVYDDRIDAMAYGVKQLVNA